MKILALEFSSHRRNAAVTDGERVLGRAEESGAAPFAPFGLISAALAQAGIPRDGIEALAIGLGPGSYTGIRAAISIAQGWQLGRGVKLLGVSSAEALAGQAREAGGCGPVHVVIDAQRQELYLATYEMSDPPREVEPLAIVDQAAARARVSAGGRCIGPEITRWFPDGEALHPDAAMVGRLAARRTDFASGEELEPIYLRAASFVKAPPPRIPPEAA